MLETLHAMRKIKQGKDLENPGLLYREEATILTFKWLTRGSPIDSMMVKHTLEGADN